MDILECEFLYLMVSPEAQKLVNGLIMDVILCLGSLYRFQSSRQVQYKRSRV